ncbi:voltage-sensitive sodium channel [Sarcoptes scabiei]|nr:voltage-sensitive sodium channel [Sarcoptes scabiei]
MDEISTDDDNCSAFNDNVSVASLWSNCTNLSFEKFLNEMDPKSKIHKTMLAILATVRDAIDLQNGTESSTEYFSGLMLALNCVESEEKLTATIALLQMVLKQVPIPVLRYKFSETSSTLMKILSQQIGRPDPNSYLCKSIIKSILILLQNQELAIWQLKSTQQIFDTILLFVLSPKPKIQGSDNPGFLIASKLTAEFCCRKLEENFSRTSNEHLNTVLYSLTLLSQIMSNFPFHSLTKRICEAILSHMVIGNVLIVTASFHCFHSFFLNRPNSAVITSDTNARLINALYEYQPNINDDQPLNAWCQTLKEGMLSLHNLNRKLFHIHTPKFLRTFINCLQNENPNTHSNIYHSIRAILSLLIDDDGDEDGDKITNDLIEKIFTELELILKYQYCHAWITMIPVFEALKIDREISRTKMGSIMQRLAIIYESKDSKINAVIEKFFAHLIKNYGPRFVLNSCPIVWKIFGTYGNENLYESGNDIVSKGEFTNYWLFTLLRKHIENNSELTLMIDHFLPMADDLKAKTVIGKKLINQIRESQSSRMDLDDESNHQNLEALTVMIKELDRCVHAIWSLLPGFCRNPIDISDCFTRIARRLGETLYDPDLFMYSLLGLRNLLRSNDECRQEVGKFAKNYLPILFNIYTNENEKTRMADSFRYSTLVVIQDLLPHLFENDSSANMFEVFYAKLLAYLNETDCSIERKNYLLDILRAFLSSRKGFDSNEEIQLIYHQILQSYINTNADTSSTILKKKSLRCLEEILISESIGCEQFRQKNIVSIAEYLFQLLNDSKLHCSLSAIVFRIINQILQKFLIESNESNTNWAQFLDNLFPIILRSLNVKSIKSRKTILKSLLIVCECFEKLFPDPIETIGHKPKVLSMLMDPFEGNAEIENDERAARLNSIVYLYRERYHCPQISQAIVADIADLILASISNSIQPPTRPILNACLEFIRYFYEMNFDLFKSYLQMITFGLTSLPQEHRTKYHKIIKNFLTKLCRKFGYEFIGQMISEDYHKVFKNIRKIESNKSKKVNGQDDDNDDDDRKSRKSSKSKHFAKLNELNFDEDFENDDDDDDRHLINDEFDEFDSDDVEAEEHDVLSRKSFSIKSRSKLDIISRISSKDIKSYIKEEIDGDPIDLLNPKSNKNVCSELPKKSRPKTMLKQENGEVSGNDSIPVCEDGRLDLREFFHQSETSKFKKGQKRSHFKIEQTASKTIVDDYDGDDGDENGTQVESKTYKSGGRGIHRTLIVYKNGSTNKSKLKKSKKTDTNSQLQTGDVYRSDKAQGDMKRKGLLAPYAYYPLNVALLNRRKAMKRKTEFETIIKGAQKGSAKGKRLRNKRSRIE